MNRRCFLLIGQDGKMMRWWGGITLSTALVIGGCASFNLDFTLEERRLIDQIQQRADKTAELYERPRPSVYVPNVPRREFVGKYDRYFIILNRAVLHSPAQLDAVVWHELAHFVLAHDAPSKSIAEQEQRELNANAKAVELMMRVGGMSEGEAVRVITSFLLMQAGSRKDPVPGHRHPCLELGDLLARYPSHQPIGASMPCPSALSAR